jgi:integral membrane protein
MLGSPIGRLRAVGMAEGLSFLLLLGVAMPLKYFAGMPLAVRIVGSVHGLLFLVFLVVLGQAAAAARWPLKTTLLVFVAALVPFGPFLVDRRLRAEEAALANVKRVG